MLARMLRGASSPSRLAHAVGCALVATLLSCGGAPHGTGATSPAASPAGDATLLLLPPVDGTPDALARLSVRARAGDTLAAWRTAHYLVDLFDATRAGDPAARPVLFAVLGLDDATGAAATDQVIDAITTRIDVVLAADRLHRGAVAARLLLEQDRHPVRARGELFARMTQLKGIARSGGPLAANALLRLADFCTRALTDAATAPPRERRRRVAYCLYPLYDSDPEPYFATDPARRPPAPMWEELLDGVAAQSRAVAASGSRLAALADVHDAALTTLRVALAPRLPPHVDPVALGLTRVPSADAWDESPLVALEPADDLDRRTAAALASHGQARVALLLAPGDDATRLVAAAAVARTAGARVVELTVAAPQALRVPAGDYWAGRITGDEVLRVAVLPLVPLDASGLPSATTPGETPGPEARFTAERAGLRLHLVVGPTEWRLVAPSGALPTLAATPMLDGVAAKDPRALLRTQLKAVRAAFPDEDSLIVVPQAGVPIATLALALVAIRAELGGVLALAAAAPQPAPSSPMAGLAARVERRARAAITIVPESLADRTAALRRCYQDAVDRNPGLAGTLTVERKALGAVGEQAVVTDGPRAPELRRCVLDRLGPAMAKTGARDARVTLAP